MATPKKKTPKGVTRARFGEYLKLQRRKLANSTALDTCQDCGETKRRHFACTTCGKYRGREVMKVKNPLDKIKKVKA